MIQEEHECFYQKQVPLQSLGIDAQSVDILSEPSPQILICEKDYLGLKVDVGYWRSMHAKAILREKVLNQTIKEQEG